MYLLQNLVQMTCQRDHLRLEISVLSTFLQLPYTVKVRALELLKIEDTYLVRPRTWEEAGNFLTADKDFLSDENSLNLEEIPQLKACIDNKKSYLIDSLKDKHYTIWLPVWMHEQVNVCLEITQSKSFDQHTLDVLIGIFNVYQNYQSLLDYSERDALTGLLNRKTFDEHLVRFSTAAQADKCNHPPWLAVIDIDHFKSVNDRFGHLFGDEVLILVANLLRSSFGSQHRVFRFGGEEFVVLLSAMSKDSAIATLENFRSMVANYSFPQVGQVTVSVGVAGTKLCSPVEILGQADQALYYAKENGRNRVCHFEALQLDGLLSNAPISHDDVELF